MACEEKEAGRNERERAVREAIDLLMDAVGGIDRAAEALAHAEELALQERARTLLSGAERLQGDVARAIGDIVRERVIDDYTLRPQQPARRRLSVA